MNNKYRFFQTFALLTALFCGAAVAVSAQVTYDNNGLAGSTNSSSVLTLSNLSVPAGNRTLVLVAIRNAGPTVVPTSVTFNSQNLTLFQSAAGTLSNHHIYYLAMGNLAAPVTDNVVITLPSTPVLQSAVAFSLKNVDQTTPLNNPAATTFDQNAAATSLTINGQAGDMAIDTLGAIGIQPTPPTFTPTAQTQIAGLTPTSSTGFGVAFSVGRRLQTGGSVTTNWITTFPASSTGGGVHNGVNVRAASVATAAGVSVGGRVTTESGSGLANVTVVLDEASGLRQTRTNSFGFFRFDDIPAGQTVVVSMRSKRYTFAPQIVPLADSVTDLNFVPLP